MDRRVKILLPLVLSISEVRKSRFSSGNPSLSNLQWHSLGLPWIQVVHWATHSCPGRERDGMLTRYKPRTPWPCNVRAKITTVKLRNRTTSPYRAGLRLKKRRDEHYDGQPDFHDSDRVTQVVHFGEQHLTMAQTANSNNARPCACTAFAVLRQLAAAVTWLFATVNVANTVNVYSLIPILCQFFTTLAIPFQPLPISSCRLEQSASDCLDFKNFT